MYLLDPITNAKTIAIFQLNVTGSWSREICPFFDSSLVKLLRHVVITLGIPTAKICVPQVRLPYLETTPANVTTME